MAQKIYSQKPSKLIINPNAGKKRKMITKGGVTLEYVKALLKQYQIEVDLAPTKHPGHATQLAKESIAQKYETVLVAGGDGTVAETANGLIGSEVAIGIIPMGSFMNIARMLSIPTEIEKAIQVLKIGRIRKIDVGTITKLEGEKLADPYYYLESAGIGLDAEIQQEFKKFEKGNLRSALTIIKKFTNFYSNKITIQTPEETITTHASLITIANGPYSGAALHLAPSAKLNDHRLTITLYQMTKIDLLRYFLTMKLHGKTDKRRLRTIQTTKANIAATKNVPFHADATLLGSTPAAIHIVPNALKVICGFPATKQDAFLKSRTILDP